MESSNSHTQDKKLRNRIAARKCREKKLKRIQNLESRLHILNQENIFLKNQLASTQFLLENQKSFKM